LSLIEIRYCYFAIFYFLSAMIVHIAQIMKNLTLNKGRGLLIQEKAKENRQGKHTPFPACIKSHWN